MKNEIEKLYELAGILKECLSPCYINKTWRKTHDCPNCDNRKNYPPFTAEKQLSLTTFIGLHYGFQMLKNEAFDYIIATKIFVKYELEYKGYGYGYDEAIANLVNNLWQDLTETEQEEIRKILRGLK